MSSDLGPGTDVSRARVHLIGGGVSGNGPEPTLAPFAEEARAHAGGRARSRLLLVLADDTGRAAEFRRLYVEALEGWSPEGFDYVDVWLDSSSQLDPAALDDVDGVVVAGGPTSVYLEGLAPAAGDLRAAVASGVPYAGFSAGAMVSATTALTGGWRDGGREVCSRRWSGGHDELTTEKGLALVDFTVDVHAAQGGLVGRALSVAGRDGIDLVVAIDEGTCLSVHSGAGRRDRWQVTGTGFVWVIEAPRAAAAAEVHRVAAGHMFTP